MEGLRWSIWHSLSWYLLSLSIYQTERILSVLFPYESFSVLQVFISIWFMPISILPWNTAIILVLDLSHIFLEIFSHVLMHYRVSSLVWLCSFSDSPRISFLCGYFPRKYGRPSRVLHTPFFFSHSYILHLLLDSKHSIAYWLLYWFLWELSHIFLPFLLEKKMEIKHSGAVSHVDISMMKISVILTLVSSQGHDSKIFLTLGAVQSVVSPRLISRRSEEMMSRHNQQHPIMQL